MAITWRNISQVNNSGNSLIQGSDDVINRGLNQLTSAARSVQEQQISDFNTQADVNTANLLNQIQQYDQNELDGVDITELQNQFGNQFDAGAVTNAVGARADELRQVARQNRIDQRADDALALDRRRTNSTIATQAQTRQANNEAREKQLKKDNFSRTVLNAVGNFDSPEELTRYINKTASDMGLNINDAQRVAQDAKANWASNIGLQQPQQEVLARVSASQQSHNSTLTSEALRHLDGIAKANGLNPVLAGLEGQNDEKLTDVFAEFDARVAETGAVWKEDSTLLFQQRFAEIFDRPPSSGEARYFLSLAIDEGNGFTDDGLNQDQIEEELTKYKDMRRDGSLIDWYTKTKNGINSASAAYAKRAADEIRKLQKQGIQNNRSRYRQEELANPVLDDSNVNLTQFAPKELSSYGWLRDKLPKS